MTLRRRVAAALPLLAALAGCAAPGPGPAAAAAAPGPDLGDCVTISETVDDFVGNVGLPTIGAAAAYATLTVGHGPREPTDTFSARRLNDGRVLVRERRDHLLAIHRMVRTPYGWISSGETGGRPSCPSLKAEFALPGEPLDVPDGRSVVDDMCGGATYEPPRTRGGATPVLAVAAVWFGKPPGDVAVRTVGERRALVRLRSGEFSYLHDVRRHGDRWRVRSHQAGGCPAIAAEFERPGQPYRGPAFRRAGR